MFWDLIHKVFSVKDVPFFLYVFISFVFSQVLSRNLASLLKLDKKDRKIIRGLIFSLLILFFGLFVILRLFVFLDSLPPEVLNNFYKH